MKDQSRQSSCALTGHRVSCDHTAGCLFAAPTIPVSPHLELQSINQSINQINQSIKSINQSMVLIIHVSLDWCKPQILDQSTNQLSPLSLQVLTAVSQSTSQRTKFYTSKYIQKADQLIR